VKHEVPVRFPFQELDLLFVGLGPQRDRHQGLRLAPGEQTRAVSPGQERHLDGDGTDLAHLASVHPDAALHDHPPDLGRLQGLEHLAGLGPPGLVEPERLPHLVEQAVDGVGPRLFLVNGQDPAQPVAHQGPDARLQVGISPRLGVERPPRLARPGHELLLDAYQLATRRVAKGDGFQHGLLRDLPGPGLDHEHGLLGPRDDQVQAGDLLLGQRGVHHEPTVHQPHPDGAHRPVERDPAQPQRGGGPVHGQHVGVVLCIRRDGQADHLHLVAEPLREEGTDGPVDEA
jgi:hypothetical protein